MVVPPNRPACERGRPRRGPLNGRADVGRICGISKGKYPYPRVAMGWQHDVPLLTVLCSRRYLSRSADRLNHRRPAGCPWDARTCIGLVRLSGSLADRGRPSGVRHRAGPGARTSPSVRSRRGVHHGDRRLTPPRTVWRSSNEGRSSMAPGVRTAAAPLVVSPEGHCTGQPGLRRRRVDPRVRRPLATWRDRPASLTKRVLVSDPRCIRACPAGGAMTRLPGQQVEAPRSSYGFYKAAGQPGRGSLEA